MFAIFLAAALMPTVAQAAPDESAALKTAAMTGEMLFRYDRAAWVGSDAAVAALKDKFPKAGGWVIEGATDHALAVTFYSGAGDARHAIFVATVRNGKVVSREALATPRPLTATQRRLADAVAVAGAEAVKRDWRPCVAKPFNAVALPPETDGGPIRIYLLTPQTKADSFPLGGHYRVDVDANGSVATARPFTKTCLEMAPPPAAKGRPAMLAVSHLLDPVPTELHVFTSYASRLPVVVILPKGQPWIVAGPRIRRVGER